MSSYTEALQDFYSGEVLGEAVYSALLGSARNDDERLKWGTLLQLETETKAWLRAPMVAHGWEFLEECEQFSPDGREYEHDDQIDAACGVFNYLTAPIKYEYIPVLNKPPHLATIKSHIFQRVDAFVNKVAGERSHGSKLIKKRRLERARSRQLQDRLCSSQDDLQYYKPERFIR